MASNNVRRLLDPFVRVRVGDTVFTSGDGLLEACSVTSAEGAGASNCSFSIYDKNRVIADRFFTYVEEIQGLVPALMQSESSAKGAWTSNGKLPASLSGFDQARLQEAIDFYLSEGFPPIATAALVGTILQESSLKTNEVSFDGNGSKGLFQWTGDRLAGMPSDFKGQLEFSLMEMDRDTPGTVAKLTDPNISEAEARQAVQDWIRWGELGARWEYADEILEAIGSEVKPAESLDKAKSPVKQPKKAKTTKAGSQITVEMGYGGAVTAAYSFLHTGLNLDVFAPDRLTFSGQAASWVLTQRKINTAYQNCTLKQIAGQICAKYGLNLSMQEYGPTYEYFAQRGITDYDSLLIECRRLGFRIQCAGNTLTIGSRQVKDSGFVLTFGENMGTSFTVSHEATGQSSGGARSSDPSDKTTTGERKFELDPDTGEMVQIALEDASEEANPLETTGGHTSILKPVESSPDGDAATRKANEKRVKGIVANFTCPTYPELLALDPDSAFYTDGISKFLNRIWVIESLTHTWDKAGFKTSGTLYSPLKNKFPAPVASTSGKGRRSPGSGSSDRNPGGFITPAEGTFTSPFGPRWGRHHNGVDIAAPAGSPVWASKDGEVITTVKGCSLGEIDCGGGFGNYIEIDHGDGTSTIYAHLNAVGVEVGDQIGQGENIGEIGSTGHSYGPHLHFEIRVNGFPVDPAQFVELGPLV